MLAGRDWATVTLGEYLDAAYVCWVEEEMAREGYTMTGGIHAVEEKLLPLEEQERVAAERRAQENLQAAIGMGVPIIGLPPELQGRGI